MQCRSTHSAQLVHVPNKSPSSKTVRRHITICFKMHTLCWCHWLDISNCMWQCSMFHATAVKNKNYNSKNNLQSVLRITIFSSVSVLCPLVLWRCWLGDRKSIQSIKNWVIGAGMVICLERGAPDFHMVQLMPLPPHRLCFSKFHNDVSFWYRQSGTHRLSWKKGH